MDVLNLAELGWQLIAMQRGSKNPGSLVGDGWPSKATNDKATIQAWTDLGLNFGVLLGPKSGVIDVEYDSDEGRDLLEHVCEGIETLAYRSAKSVHRIFLWDERFAFEKAKFGFRGTEWRFGQDKAQSVIPPSIHPDGPAYEWINDCLPIRLPDSLWDLFCGLKDSYERKTARAQPVAIAPRDKTGDSIIDLARAEAEKLSWESLLSSRGWTFVRNRGEAQDWHRPGKKAGSISGTVNYGDSGTLRVFSTGVAPLEADSSYDKFAFLCVLEHNDDPMKAAKSILPQEVQDELTRKWLESKRDTFDSSACLLDRDPDTDDEEFCESMIPAAGLLRDVANYVSSSSYKPSPVFSLATSISLCQTIFGRKAKSETGLRTNDFHLILAPTSAGKEGPLEAMTNLLGSVNAESYIMPGSISGPTALLDCLEEHPHHIQNWVCDEFGYVLSVMLDKKARDPHAKGIAKKMLELYGCSKRKYTGGANAGKIRKHAMNQPHLCALGVSTGFTVFKEVSEDQVHDGLLGRISFWSLQRRPRPNRKLRTEVPDNLKAAISSWLEFSPTGPQNLTPNPIELPFSGEARRRWEQHEDSILEKMEQERAIRAALWGRTAARSMKLALTHRLARIPNVAELNEFSQIKIELEDANWGIAVSNHCTKLACSMVRESVTDTSGNRLSEKVLAIVRNAGDGISKAELKSRLKTSDAGAIWAAVTELETAKALRTWTEPTSGRPKLMVGVIRGNNLVQN